MDTNSVIAAIPSSRSFAAQVSSILEFKQVPIEFRTFADGNCWSKYEDSIRGSRVYIFASTDGAPPSGSAKKLEELRQLISASVLASAAKVIAVMPYFEARQDQKDQPRVDITAARWAKEIIHAGATRVITMDLHAKQIQGFFWPIPVDHLYASWCFKKWYDTNKPNISAVGSPDVGGNARAEWYATQLKTNLVFTFKGIRPKQNESRVLGTAGTVGDGGLLLVDDVIDTAGTLVHAVEEWDKTGVQDIYGFIPHPILSTDSKGTEAIYRIEQSPIKKLYVTDSIPLKRQSPKIQVISAAELFAEAIRADANNDSINHLFLDKQK